MDYLIKMIDGGLKEVLEDKDCEWSGCETCDYGSKYITEFTLVLDSFNLEVKIGDMYDAPYSEEELMKLLCGNIEFIQNLKEEAFVRFVKKKVTEVCEKNGYCYEPEFKKIENV